MDQKNNNIDEAIQTLQIVDGLVDNTGRLIIQNFLNKIYDLGEGNYQVLDEVLDFVNKNILKVMIEHAKLILQNIDLQGNQIYLDFELKKLQMVEKLLPDIMNTSSNSFFCLPVDHQELVELNNAIMIVEIDNEENIKKSLEQFSQMVYVGHAFTSSGAGLNNIIQKFFVTNSSGLYYLINREQARQKAVQILTNPTIDHVTTTWSVIEKSALVKNMIKSMLDSVETKLVMYIPKIFEPITLGNLEPNDYLSSLPASLMFDRLFQSIFQKQLRHSRVKIRVLSSQKEFVRQNIESSELCNIINSLPRKTHDKINFNGQQIQQLAPQFSGCCTSRGNTVMADKKQNLVKKVVIHFHGGGFVAMSSFSHQTYTRKWANYLGDDTVVFSVDYRLAPNNPFPSGLDDCWQSYLWIVNFAQCYFNLSPEQIILSGDSAGGNFALAVTIRAIQHKIRVPDGLFLMYPALVLDLTMFTPSLLKTLTDRIVPFSILEICINSYLPQNVDPKHHYVSPGLCQDRQILNKLPEKITIITGTEDCLKDQSIGFVHKMHLINKKPNLTIYKHFPHGFMNYAFPGFGLQQAIPVVQKSCQLLRQLFI